MLFINMWANYMLKNFLELTILKYDNKKIVEFTHFFVNERKNCNDKY